MAGMQTAGAIHASEHFHFDKTKDGTDASARAPSRKAKDSEVLCTRKDGSSPRLGTVVSEYRGCRLQSQASVTVDAEGS
jgi:hypothetical protein